MDKQTIHSMDVHFVARNDESLRASILNFQGPLPGKGDFVRVNGQDFGNPNHYIHEIEVTDTQDVRYVKQDVTVFTVAATSVRR